MATVKKTIELINQSTSIFAKIIKNLEQPIKQIDFLEENLKKITSISDDYINLDTRLNTINTGSFKTNDLQNKIFQSAQRTNVNYASMANSVARMGVVAKDRFSNAEELVIFNELMNKVFKINGLSNIEQDAGMYKLTQALSDGVLYGDEYNDIVGQAPYLIDAISKYMNISKDELQDLSSKGRITADIIKGALYSNANEIENRYKKLPKTFENIGINFKNELGSIFQNVLKKLNILANNKELDKIKDNVLNIFRYIADIAEIFIDKLNNGGLTLISDIFYKIESGIKIIFNIIVNLTSFISKKFNIIKNIIYLTIGGGFAFIFFKITALISEVKKLSEKFKKFNIEKIDPKSLGISILIMSITFLILKFVELYTTNEEFRNEMIYIWENIRAAVFLTVTAISVVLTTLFISKIAMAVKSIFGLVNAIKLLALQNIGLLKSFFVSNWQLLLLIGAIFFAIYVWNELGETGKILAVIIGIIIGLVILWISVQWALNIAMAANPIIMIISVLIILISAIIVVIIWLITLWQTNLDFKYAILSIWTEISNAFDVIVTSIINLFRQLLISISKTMLNIVENAENMVNSVIKAINWLITQINKLPGVNLALLDFVDATNITSFLEKAIENAQTDIEESEKKLFEKQKDRYKKLFEDRLKDEKDLEKRRQSAIKEKSKLDKYTQSGEKELDIEKQMKKYLKGLDPNKANLTNDKSGGKNPSTKVKGGKIEDVGKIKDNINISDENLRLLKEVEKRKFINQFTTLRPEVKVTFGDVKETVDVNKLMCTLETMIEDAYATALTEGV